MNNVWKILLGLVAAALLAAGGWLLYMKYGPQLAVESVVPSGAVGYARIAQPTMHWENLSKSEFWKNASAIDLPNVLARNNVPREQILRLQHSQQEIEAFLKNRLTRKFLDREIALAVYPPAALKPDLNKDYDILWVLRLPLTLQAFKFVDDFLYQGGDEVVSRQENYAGERITHVHWKKQDLSLKYALLRDLLVIGPETSAKVNQAIDVYHRKFPSLKQEGNFAFIQSRAYPNADGLLYLNAETFDGLLKAEGVDPLLSTSGFKAIGLSFLTPGQLMRYKFIVGLDESQIKEPEIQSMFSCAPQDNVSLRFIPAEIIGYQWSGCYDFTGIWQRAKAGLKVLPKVGGAKSLVHGMQKRLGAAIDNELLPLLGREAGGYLSDVDTVGVFPYPRLLTFVKVKDAKKAAAVMEKIIGNPLGLIQEEDYNQVKIHYVPLSFLGPNMDPAYCFVDGYLLAASSRQLLKKSIDAYHDPLRSLRSDKTFHVFGLEPIAKSQSITFLKVGAVAKIAHDILDRRNIYWSSQVSAVSTYKQESKVKKRELADGVAARKAELKLALVKLQELKAKPTDTLSADDQTLLAGSIENLDKQTQELKDDIQAYLSQQQELEGLLANYENQADSAKLLMFNSQQLFVPLLKGLETVNAQGLKVMINGKAIETELMFN